MKKLLVVLLAALLLFSFTSCNQDKIDELEAQVAQKEAQVKQKEADNEATIKNYEDFMAAFSITESLNKTTYGKLLDDKTELSLDTLTETDLAKIKFGADFIERFVTLGAKESIYESAEYPNNNPTAKKATGKVKYKKDVDSATSSTAITYEFDKVSFNVKYYVGSNERELEGLELSGELSIQFSGVSESSGSQTISFNGTINNTAYNFSCTVSNKDGVVQFTAAKVNGNDVELRLLNANVDYTL